MVGGAARRVPAVLGIASPLVGHVLSSDHLTLRPPSTSVVSVNGSTTREVDATMTTREVMTSSAIERAAEIGTEHGKAAAEAWLADCPPRVQSMIRSHVGPLSDLVGGLVVDWVPEPDLSGDYSAHDLDAAMIAVDPLWATDEDAQRATLDAYEAAFTAAVEATVRNAVAGDERSESQS